MSRNRRQNRATSIASLLVLGVGLAALFLGYGWFWVVFALGFAVVVPLVDQLTRTGDASELSGEDRVDDAAQTDTLGGGEESKREALDVLRDRYARGELSDEQFERKLQTLLDTETLEDSRERLGSELEPERSR